MGPHDHGTRCGCADSQNLAARLFEMQRAAMDLAASLSRAEDERDAARADLRRERAETARLREALVAIERDAFHSPHCEVGRCIDRCSLRLARAALSPAAEPAPPMTVRAKSRIDIEGFPRRNRLDHNTPAEMAIRAAVDAVEKVGAHPLLTEIVMNLDRAREKLADYVDATLLAEPAPPKEPTP